MGRKPSPDRDIIIRSREEFQAVLGSAVRGTRVVIPAGQVFLQSDPIHPVGGIGASPDKPSDTLPDDDTHRR
jgi:hypothetical protein